MISDQRYLNWQKELVSRIFFRRFWSFWAIYSIFLVFLSGVYILFSDKPKVIIIALAAFILGRLIVSPLIYLFYKKERPYQKLKFEVTQSKLFSTVVKRHNSFPSDHSISFASITLVLTFYFPLLGISLIIAGILNGIGRIILGYHYAMDIFAGWVTGLLSGLIVVYWLAPLLFTH